MTEMPPSNTPWPMVQAGDNVEPMHLYVEALIEHVNGECGDRSGPRLAKQGAMRKGWRPRGDHDRQLMASSQSYIGIGDQRLARGDYCAASASQRPADIIV